MNMYVCWHIVIHIHIWYPKLCKILQLCLVQHPHPIVCAYKMYSYQKHPKTVDIWDVASPEIGQLCCENHWVCGRQTIWRITVCPYRCSETNVETHTRLLSDLKNLGSQARWPRNIYFPGAFLTADYASCIALCPDHFRPALKPVQ